MSTQALVVLAVDPGREKCGMAVLRSPAPHGAGGAPRVLARAVVEVAEFGATAARWGGEFGVNTVALGDRTASEQVRILLAGALPNTPIVTIDEAGTTQAARSRYFAEHPPRGWKRLLPLSMLVPPEPYDDYVAILLGERFLAAYGTGAKGPRTRTRGLLGRRRRPEDGV
ncbi:MAG: pre-16S rRNA-processing nuclease YqgF [Gemmatimonadales bacterium]